MVRMGLYLELLWMQAIGSLEFYEIWQDLSNQATLLSTLDAM